jgi:hypothetical protein
MRAGSAFFTICFVRSRCGNITSPASRIGATQSVMTSLMLEIAWSVRRTLRFDHGSYERWPMP